MLSPLAVQIAVVILAVLSVGGLLSAALYPRLAAKSAAGKRLESAGASKRRPIDRVAGNEESRRKRSVEDTLKELEQVQKKAKRSSRPTLTVRMRQAGIDWGRNGYILVCVIAGFLTFGLTLLIFGLGMLPSIAFGISGGILLPHIYVGFRRKRRLKKFSDEFPNAVDVIVRGVKAGLPLADCLKIIASEAQEPVRSEFQLVTEDQTLGLPLAEAVMRLPERIPITEANFFAIVIAIQSRTGGSLSEALSNLSKVLRDRKKMQAKIRAMSQEAKSSAAIIGALPLVVTSILYMVSPDYILLLFQTTVGNIVLAISGMWMLMGVLVMRQMINFDF